MNCPRCRNTTRCEGGVVHAPDGIRRDRHCQRCDYKFISVERDGVETFVRTIKHRKTAGTPGAPWGDFLAMEEPINQKWEGVEDRWGIVCEHCPLYDCVRGAGEYLTNLTTQYTPGATECPIFRAVELGQTPAQLLADILQSGNDAAQPVPDKRKEVVSRAVVLKGVAYQSL